MRGFRASALPSSTTSGGGRHGEFIVTPDSIWAPLFPSDVRNESDVRRYCPRGAYGIDKSASS